MKKVNAMEMRNVEGGATWQCYNCGKKIKVTGLFTSWKAFVHQFFTCKG